MPPIPIEKAIQRLLYWISPTGYGFARVEFKLPLTQREAWSRLKSRLEPILAERGMTTSEVIFPTPINPARLAVQLRDQLQAAPPGVISVPWSLSWFPNEAALAETLGHLNFLRDGLALPHLHQIWWMETAFADRFIPSIPDLESWFTLRLELEDLPLPKTGIIWQDSSEAPEVDPRQARKTAQMLAERARNALRKGDSPERVWNELLAPARKLLLEATLPAEVDELAKEFPSFLALLLDEGDLLGARQKAEQDFANAEETYGKIASETAAASNNFATVLTAQGDLPRAHAFAENALAISENVFGPKHPSVALSAATLAHILQAQGDLAQARSLTERALAIADAHFGPQHPTVANIASNLAQILQDQGDLSQARALTERALAIDEANFGPQHPKVAIRASNLASIAYAQAELSLAGELSERALKINEANFGPNHPQVAVYANNFAQILQAQGDLPQARTLAERALSIALTTFGPENPTTKAFAANLEALTSSS